MAALNDSVLKAARQVVQSSPALQSSNNLDNFLPDYDSFYRQELYNQTQPFSSFSPFSPDPNHLQRDMRSGQDTAFSGHLAHGENGGLNGFAPRFGASNGTGAVTTTGASAARLNNPIEQTSTTNVNGKIERPTQAVRRPVPEWRNPPMGSGMFSLGQEQLYRFRMSPESKIQRSTTRPLSAQKIRNSGTDDHHDQDLADVNGTLASLELDHNLSPGSTRSRGDFSDSSESVQFRVSMTSPVTTP